jgi:hypothetical protein
MDLEEAIFVHTNNALDGIDSVPLGYFRAWTSHLENSTGAFSRLGGRAIFERPLLVVTQSYVCVCII